jgi:hypothetical protein
MFIAYPDCFSSKYGNFWGKKFQKHHLALGHKCGSRNQKAWSVVSIEIVGGCPVRVCFCGEFSPPGDQKKRGLANPTKGFLRIKKPICHILRKKKGQKSPDLDSVFH